MEKLYGKKMFEEIPFNDLVQADDWDLIEGVNTPDNGADVTGDNEAATIAGQGNLATKDQVDTAEIVNGAVEKVKMALLSVDADIVAASAITENKLFTGAVTANKIASNAITSVKILANAVVAGKIGANAVTANEMNVSTLSAITANVGTLTSGSITGLTITGGTIRTNASSYPYAVMNSSGLTIHGRYLTFKSSGGTGVGQIYAENTTNLQVYTYNGKTLELGGASGASLNAGGNNCELRQGNTAIIRINGTNYSGFVGTSSNIFNAMYSQVYYFGRSGYSTKYIQRGTSGIEVNTNFYVGGVLSKSSGSFKIDHPLKPKTHWLEHSFVESPDMLNLYTGNGEIKNGEFKIKMPDWFIPLNGKNKDEFTYQLTSIGQFNDLMVKQEMNDKGEVIFAGKKDGKFSYIITAIRHDKWAENNRVQVETKK